MARSIKILAAAVGVVAVGVLGGAVVHPVLVNNAESQSFIQLPPLTNAEAAFDKLKSLVGTWKGKAAHGGEAQDAEVQYRLSGGGSALIETLFPGTEHEMVTVYTRDRDSILLTHYCAMGNQPRMRCTPEGDYSTLKFDFVDGGNMASTDEPHMHSLAMKFDGSDRLNHAWTFYRDGKAQDQALFTLERAADKSAAAGDGCCTTGEGGAAAACCADKEKK